MQPAAKKLSFFPIGCFACMHESLLMQQQICICHPQSFALQTAGLVLLSTHLLNGIASTEQLLNKRLDGPLTPYW